jgi:hypothetical protein
VKPNLPLLLALAPLAGGLPACPSRPEVRYGDPGAVETLTIDFGSTDLQKIAADLTDSVLKSSIFAGPDRPVIYVGKVENRTSEHIDTVNITDSIKTAIVQSGKARVAADPAGRAEIGEQLDYQRSGAVSPETMTELGRQIGSDFVLYGRFTSIEKKAGSEKDVYYKFTLNLVDVESGVLEWAKEVEIRKTQTKASIGW